MRTTPTPPKMPILRTPREGQLGSSVKIVADRIEAGANKAARTRAAGIKAHRIEVAGREGINIETFRIEAAMI